MPIEVLSKSGQILSRFVSSFSLGDDGQLARLRRTALALFGLVTAIGLGLVVFISQQGWPGVFSAPIPGNPPELGVVRNDAIALQTVSTGAAPQGGARRRNATPVRSGGGIGATGDAGLDGSRQIGEAPTPQAPPVEQSPSSPSPAPAPTPAIEPQPVSPAPAPSPDSSTPVAESPAVESESHSKGSRGYKSKTKGHSVPSDYSPTKSKDYDYNYPGTGKSKGYSSGKSKGHAPEKSVDDGGDDYDEGSSSYTPPPPSSKDWSGQSDYPGKEVESPGKYGGSWNKGYQK